MKDINRNQTADSPAINFNKNTKTLSITGNSYPENCSSIYEPILDFIVNYDVEELKKLQINFYFNLVNSTSVVYISKLLLNASSLTKNGLDVGVKWSYDQFDEELLDLGEKFASIAELEFEYVPIKDENDEM